jgi:large subunit ribosomal protein L18
MKVKNKKEYRRLRIKHRIRKIVKGTSDRPRMCIFRSNKQIYVQLIDDNEGRTILCASSRDKGILDQQVNKTEKSVLVGKLVAERALEQNITNVVFDRNGYLYHGRIKALAEAAREGGLKF